MSRGPGRVQRTVAALFDANPAKIFTAVQLARHFFATAAPSRIQLNSVRWSADQIAEQHGRVRINGGRVRYIPQSQYQPRPNE